MCSSQEDQIHPQHLPPPTFNRVDKAPQLTAIEVRFYPCVLVYKPIDKGKKCDIITTTQKTMFKEMGL